MKTAGDISDILVLAFIVGGVAGSFAGSRAAARLAKRRGALTTVFAVLVLAVAAYMLWRGLGALGL